MSCLKAGCTMTGNVESSINMWKTELWQIMLVRNRNLRWNAGLSVIHRPPSEKKQGRRLPTVQFTVVLCSRSACSLSSFLNSNLNASMASSEI